MNQEEMKAKLEEAAKDEAFLKQLKETKSAEEAQKLFESRGICFSLEEVKAMASKVGEADGELSDDALENVSGGAKWSLIPGVILTIIRVITQGGRTYW